MKKELDKDVAGQWLSLEEVRLVSDLRIMHAKVDELHHIVSKLKRRHNDQAIHRYADQTVLAEDIVAVDEIYLWFVGLKEEAQRAKRRLKRV